MTNPDDTDFDIEAVHRLVDEATADFSTAVVEVVERPAAVVHLSGTDTSLLEKLAEVLPNYTSDGQSLLSELRSSLIAGTEVPELDYYYSLIKRCRRCPTMTANVYNPWGNTVDPDIVVVFEGPPTDVWQSYVWKLLRETEIDSFSVTYLTRCKPLEDEHRNPTADEISNCQKYLFTEIEVLRPKLVLLLGSVVSNVFLGPIKITEDHGKIFWLGVWAVMPLLSPGYVLKNEAGDLLTQDLRKAKQFVSKVK